MGGRKPKQENILVIYRHLLISRASCNPVHEALYRHMRELEDRHWWFLGRRRIVRSVIAELCLGPDITILDAGCGTGGNLSMLRKFGQVVGAEYDEAAAAIAHERDVAQIVRAGLPDEMPFDKEQFQLITLLDVLEHIDDDQGSLQTLSGLLHRGGYLVLTVPAFPFLWSTHDTEHHHKRRYRAAQLRQVIEACGLQVQWLSYYNMWLFPAVAVVRLMRKLLPGREVSSELALPPAPLNGLLEAHFPSECLWLGRLSAPFGVSIMAVARKP
jgi:SAM-dependent methyltransferase